MDGDRPALGIHTRAEHTRRSEQHTHLPLVHRLDDRLPCLLGLALLNEADFMGGYAVVLHQLALDFGIDAPSAARLECTEVAEHELRTPLRIVFMIVFRYHLGAMARLVVGVVFVIRVNHAHVQCHLPGIVRGDEHLRLFLCFRQRRPA